MIGCRLVRSNKNEEILRGIIVETEAYSQEDEACHGFNKRTNSNEVLFGEPGNYYVYQSYGLHHCLNVVRSDANNKFENRDELLNLAPDRENDFFKVPKIIKS